jgi:hypothetical protein
MHSLRDFVRFFLRAKINERGLRADVQAMPAIHDKSFCGGKNLRREC